MSGFYDNVTYRSETCYFVLLSLRQAKYRRYYQALSSKATAFIGIPNNMFQDTASFSGMLLYLQTSIIFSPLLIRLCYKMYKD